MKSDKYRLIVTGDGSYSLQDSSFNEQMHTKHGAYKESVYKHIIPSKITEIKKDAINILDIGFGAGYNILSTCEMLYGKKKLNIISFEYDNSAVPKLKEIQFGDKRDEFYEKIIQAIEHGKFTSSLLNIEIHYGDARKSIRTIEKPEDGFDAVFHDPFSPNKNCELWTYEFFKRIYDLISKNGMLTTYSSAPQIRMALLECGFFVGKSKNKAFIKDGTVASKNKVLIKNPLDKNVLIEKKFAKSYRDPDLCLSRDEIYNIYEKEANL